MAEGNEFAREFAFYNALKKKYPGVEADLKAVIKYAPQQSGWVQ